MTTLEKINVIKNIYINYLIFHIRFYKVFTKYIFINNIRTLFKRNKRNYKQMHKLQIQDLTNYHRQIFVTYDQSRDG